MDTSELSSELTLLPGFDWNTLSKGSTVVDVGGGNGSQSLVLARNFPDLQFVVQDREMVTPSAIQFWKEQGLGDYLESGKTKIQGRNIAYVDLTRLSFP